MNLYIRSGIVYGLALLWITQSSIAQQLNYCGTPPDLPHWRWYMQHREAGVEFREDTTTLYVPVMIYSVFKEKDYVSTNIHFILRTLARANSDFRRANIQFYLFEEPDYLINDRWFSHDYYGGQEMMEVNNIDGAINIYFVGSPAGNCGYYSPAADAIAMAYACGGHSATISHELGHFLSLPHTFFGWEGTEYFPNSKASNYSHVVFRPIETVDGSNCQEAGDGFCDTSPDYLSYRWTCNRDSMSSISLTDPNGAQFHADGRNIMSYANDYCPTMFSKEQIQAMRTNLTQLRSELVHERPPQQPIPPTKISTLLFPYGHPVPPDTPVIAWNTVPNAMYYYVQVSRRRSFNGPLVLDTITSDTALWIPGLRSGNTYYVRIYPYNLVTFDNGWSERMKFQTATTSSTFTAARHNGIALYPTCVRRGTPITIHTNGQIVDAVSILSLYGKTVDYIKVKPLEVITLPTDALAPGTYILQLYDRRGISHRAVFVVQ